MGLVEWLLEQIAEDERIALDDDDPDAIDYDSYGYHPDGFESEIIYSSARVLAECAAKRAIIKEHAPNDDGECRTCLLETHESGTTLPGTHTPSYAQRLQHRTASPYPCLTLCLVAHAYRDRDGWQPEWLAIPPRPDEPPLAKEQG